MIKVTIDTKIRYLRKDIALLIPLLKYKIPYQSDRKAFADRKINFAEFIKFFFKGIENILKDKKKFWFLAFSGFSSVFKSSFPLLVIKTGVCQIKG